jgi:hypothetical protein
MKLAKVTLEILRNLASINQGIIIRPGSRLVTMNVMKSMFVNATIPDVFPKEFAIYDLNELLQSISAFNDPEIEFFDDKLTISEGSDEVEYRYSNPNVVISPGDRKITLTSEDKTFTLTKTHLDRIDKFASIHKLKEIKIDCKQICVLNRNNVGNRFSIQMDIRCTADMPDSFLKVENLKLIPVDYDVAISSKRIARFTSKSSDYPIEYYLTLEMGDDK